MRSTLIWTISQRGCALAWKPAAKSAYLSRKLAMIITDLPVTLDLEKARADHFDPAAVEALFRELEFRSLVPRLKTLGRPAGHSTPVSSQQLTLFNVEPKIASVPSPSSLKVRVIDTPESLQDLVRELSGAEIIAFDTETTSTDPMRANLVGISLSVRPGEGYYIPVGHLTDQPQLPLEVVIEALHGPMTDPHLPKMGHNLKYDYLMLKRNGLVVAPMTLDTMIAEWLIDPASRNLGLKNLAWVRLGVEMTHIEDLIGKGKKQLSMAEVPVDLAASYAAADAETTLRLKPMVEPDLARQNATKLLVELEMPLIPILAEMEETGVALNVPFFAANGHRPEQAHGRDRKRGLFRRWQIHSTSIPPSSSRISSSNTSSWSLLTRARRPPAAISPPRPMSWRRCAASIPWSMGFWNTVSWPS